MKKISAIAICAGTTFAGTMFAGTATAETRPVEQDDGTFLRAEPPSDSAGKYYPPARAAVRVREHLVTPFYVLCAQRLPASLSGGGKMASSSYGAGFSWRYVHPEKKRIAFTTADFLHTDYRFTGGRDAPFRRTDAISATTYHELINPHTGLAGVGVASFTASTSDRAAMSDGFGGFFALGAKQYFSEKTSVALGVSALYRFDRERWFFYPFFTFDWSISENLNLRLLNGVSLTWDVGGDNSFLLDFSLNYRTSAFAAEVEHDAASPYFDKSGAYREQSVPASLTGTWNVTENFFVSAGVTLLVWNKFRLCRAGHNTSEKFTVDPAVEFVLQAGVKF